MTAVLPGASTDVETVPPTSPATAPAGGASNQALVSTAARASGVAPRSDTASRPALRAEPSRGRDDGWAVVSTAGTMVALVCLWLAAQLLFLSTFSEQRAQDLLYTQFRTDVAAATAPLGGTIDSGTPVALLTIPRVGISQVVVEGTDSADTMSGPGHLRRTVLPGQVGAAVVMGRSATYGAPFRDLDALRPGDAITAVMSQGTVTYRVLDLRRAGDPFPQPLQAGRARLTLETAEGSGALGSLRPGGVLYVDAEADKGFVPPSGTPTAVPDSEQVLGTDHGALPLLVLYLALLVALTLGVVAARQRWSAPLVWVVTTPVALALAWATTDVAIRLLPNVV